MFDQFHASLLNKSNNFFQKNVLTPMVVDFRFAKHKNICTRSVDIHFMASQYWPKRINESSVSWILNSLTLALGRCKYCSEVFRHPYLLCGFLVWEKAVWPLTHFWMNYSFKIKHALSTPALVIPLMWFISHWITTIFLICQSINLSFITTVSDGIPLTNSAWDVSWLGFIFPAY